MRSKNHNVPVWRNLELIGVQVDAFTIEVLNQIVDEHVRTDRQTIIANHNLHSIYLYHRCRRMREFYARANYTHIDGISLVLVGRLLGLPLHVEHRVTYVDWIHPLLKRGVASNWRLFYLGSKPNVLECGLATIRRQYPDLEVDGHHGYFDTDPQGEENRKVLHRIRAFNPDVIMVGMGMPRQEVWIADNAECLPDAVILPSGACLDYLAGAVPTPPRWMGPIGLEWLYRFTKEPRRLWYRHFVEPLTLLPRLIQDLVRYRFSGAETDHDPADVSIQ